MKNIILSAFLFSASFAAYGDNLSGIRTGPTNYQSISANAPIDLSFTPPVYQKTSESPIPVNIRGVPSSYPPQFQGVNPSNLPFFGGSQYQSLQQIPNPNDYGYPLPRPAPQSALENPIKTLHM